MMPAPAASPFFQHVAALLKGFDPTQGPIELIADALQRAVIGYLTYTQDAAQRLSAQPAVLEGLRNQLAALPYIKPEGVTLIATDVTEDAQDDLLVSLQGAMGLPIFACVRQGAGYMAVTLPVALTGEHPMALDPTSMPGEIRALDTTGEGRPEVLFVYKSFGASSLTDRLYIMRYIVQTQAFDLIFRATLVSWAQPATWELREYGAGQDVVLHYPYFGPYDHKMLPHPEATQLWRWAEAAGRYVLVKEEVMPPASVRQQVNVAEALFRAARYEEALKEYTAAIQNQALADEQGQEGAQPDWRGYARLRRGMCHALLGNEPQAREDMLAVRVGGGTLKALADGFLAGYKGTDAAIRGWAAMVEAVDLYGLLSEEKGGNVAFPMDAFGIYSTQVAVCAYLDAHPEFVTQGCDALLQSLSQVGLRVRSALCTDTDHDGQLEVVFVTADTDMARNWVAKRGLRWSPSPLQTGPAPDIWPMVGLPGNMP
jgi:hypothetical protein